VGDIRTSTLATDLSPPAFSLTIDEAYITLKSLFPEETDFQYYEFTSLSPELQV
jgi:hypothetical protein